MEGFHLQTAALPALHSKVSARRRGEECVGKRVAKVFNEALYFGSVTAFFPSHKMDHSPDHWAVSYDDGDKEDLNRSDLNKALDLYRRESLHDNEAVHIASETARMSKSKSEDTSSSTAEPRTPPPDYIGHKVATRFDGQVVIGSVTKFSDDLYEVTYDNDGVEELRLSALEIKMNQYENLGKDFGCDDALSEAYAGVDSDEDLGQPVFQRRTVKSSSEEKIGKPVFQCPPLAYDSDEELGQPVFLKCTTTSNAQTQPVGFLRVTPSPDPESKLTSTKNAPCFSAAVLSALPSFDAAFSQAYVRNSSIVSNRASSFVSSVAGLPNTMRFAATKSTFSSMTAAEVHDGTDFNEDMTKSIGVKEELVNWRETQKELDAMFEKESTEKFTDVPPFVRPPGFQHHLKLYDYQKDGIRWMLHHERNEDSLPPFWFQTKLGLNNGNLWWKCKLTHRMQKSRPDPIRGSILADDMGLGKTLQTIGLILSNPAAKGRPRCTLIVCPVSVMANWKTQIEQFVKPGVLNVALYHGSKREHVLTLVKWNELDILITSYGTLASDLKRHEEYLEEQEEENTYLKKPKGEAKRDEKGGYDWKQESMHALDEDVDHDLQKKRRRKRFPEHWIFDLPFWRVCLDEAHTIRNSGTGFFKATTSVPSELRLAITGTPFINRPTDLHSLFSFLDARPLSEKPVFAHSVINPILNRQEIGLSRIRTMMGHIAIRRTKELVESTIQLVSKRVTIQSVPWQDGLHKSIHDVLYDTARAAFIGLLKKGTQKVFDNFFELLTLVLRIRQSCCHGGLIGQANREVAEEVQRELEAGTIKGEILFWKLFNSVRDQDAVSSECAVCSNELEHQNAMVLRSCQHVFCYTCLDGVRNQLCPVCNKPFEPEDKIARSAVLATARRKKKKARQKYVSDIAEVAPKIQAMLAAIDEMAKDEKAVIFSQWTSFLDIIQNALDQNSHTYTRIDGTMSASERIDAMDAFSSENERTSPRFILCSLHACGTGINLTRGNVVFMMDCWWNVAVENQAMDRVHRLGQSRPVRATRFIMENSMEQRVISLQSAKEALGKGSLQKLTRAERRRARITALKDLFEVKDEMKDWEGHFEDDDDASDLRGFIVGDNVND